MSAAYGLVFAVLAALMGLTAALVPGWAAPLAGGVAFSFLIVAAAYSGGRPQLLFKRATGRRPAWAWAVHWPYFAFAAAGYRLSLLLTREVAHARVLPNLSFGRRLTAREAARGDAENWVAVLDLAAELPAPGPFRRRPNYRSLPVLDATAMGLDQLREAVAWVRASAAVGPVYVHCALGHGRSALVVAAYLVAERLAPDAKAAVARLRDLRPGVRLNRPQRAALAAFAAGLTSGP